MRAILLCGTLGDAGITASSPGSVLEFYVLGGCSTKPRACAALAQQRRRLLRALFAAFFNAARCCRAVPLAPHTRSHARALLQRAGAAHCVSPRAASRHSLSSLAPRCAALLRSFCSSCAHCCHAPACSTRCLAAAPHVYCSCAALSYRAAGVWRIVLYITRCTAHTAPAWVWVYPAWILCLYSTWVGITILMPLMIQYFWITTFTPTCLPSPPPPTPPPAASTPLPCACAPPACLPAALHRAPAHAHLPPPLCLPCLTHLLLPRLPTARHRTAACLRHCPHAPAACAAPAATACCLPHHAPATLPACNAFNNHHRICHISIRSRVTVYCAARVARQHQ